MLDIILLLPFDYLAPALAAILIDSWELGKGLITLGMQLRSLLVLHVIREGLVPNPSARHCLL